jgi:hypothetical protein
MGDNFWNEVVTIHRPQEVLKMLSSLHVEEECIEDIGGKARRKETTRKTKM